MTKSGKMKLPIGALALALAMAPAPAFATSDPAILAAETKLSQAQAAMMGDSAEALRLAQEVRDEASEDTRATQRIRLTARWLEGEALIRLNRATEAKAIIADTLDEAGESFANEKLYADLLRSSATLYALEGHYGEALSAFLEAHGRYVALEDTRSQAIVLQNIGSLYSDARDYERVTRYYRDANQAHAGDVALALSAHNNIGNALKELGRFEEAEAEFSIALERAKEMGSPMLEARILTNIASTQYHLKKYADASKTIQHSLQISQRSAPDWLPFVYGVRSQIRLARRDYDGARADIARVFAGQDLETTSPYFRDFHQTAYEVLRGKGDYRGALPHLAAYHRLEGQAQDLSAEANNALLAARFDSESRDLRISKLSAQNQAKEARLASSQNRVWLLGMAIVFSFAALFTLLILLRTMSRSKSAISEANQKLTYVTQHDGLTGLHSRDHFRSLLEKETEAAKKTDALGVLMLIDLDRFKQVNDTFGHAAGDRLLVEAAVRFRDAAGPKAVIGRLGGDEFALFLPHPRAIEDAWEIAQNIIERVALPFHFEGHEMTVGASIGIARIDKSVASTSALITNGDLALYEAKHRGRGTYVNYTPSMRSKLEERVSIENDLSRALENGELSVSYQPIVDGVTGQTRCYEALMRWTHPVRGEVAPDQFVPVAEDALLIAPLGSWLLRTACRDAMTWDENIKLTVNVSALQLSNPVFLSTVIDALAKSGLAPHRLVLELTETVVLEMSEDVERLIHSLTDLGVSFALDDFGKGYSSLNYIEKMQFSMIKIDRDFVQAAAAGSQKSQAVVAAIVSLARSLDIDVTAEGIEESSQAEAMLDLGCSCFQGFHFGLPGPVDIANVIITPGNAKDEKNAA